MATADTPLEPGSPPTEPAPPATGLAALPVVRNFNALEPKQKIGYLAAFALGISLIIGAWLWGRAPDYSVLFSNLSDKDGGAITTALTQQNVPYKFSEGGTAILVPSQMVHDVRLRLASQGLPKGGLVGFELMENQKLGISQFAEQVNYQRALEGELARSIQSLAAVESARVHLAIPKQTGFLREEQKPTASVLVNLRPGRVLDGAQVGGMVHLVASSVPQLSPNQVSVIDQNGELLSPKNDPMRNSNLDPAQIKYVRDLEQNYIKRIESILTPVVGEANVRAQVTADVDFNQVEQTAETFRPNQTPNQPSVRSQQTSESSSNQAGGTGGIPGALSNQPPGPASAPVANPATPTPAAAAGANAATTAAAQTSAGAPNTTRKDATVNYELDKTVSHTKVSVGSIKRLSVAVVVNQKKEVGKDGKAKAVPLSEAEMNQINALVKEAVGYSEPRGDTVNVANAAFNQEKEAKPELPLWKDPENIALAKEAGRWLLIALLILYAWFGIIRPLLRKLTGQEEEARKKAEAEAAAKAEAEAAKAEAAGEADLPDEEQALAEEGEQGPHPPTYDEKLQMAKDLAKNEPKLVANVIKEWMEGGGNG